MENEKENEQAQAPPKEASLSQSKGVAGRVEDAADSGTEPDVENEQLIEERKLSEVNVVDTSGALDDKDDSNSKRKAATMSAEQDSSASFSKLSRSFKVDRGDARETTPNNQENQESYQQAVLKYFVSDSNTNFVALSHDEEQHLPQQHALLPPRLAELMMLQKSADIAKLSFDESQQQPNITFKKKLEHRASISNDEEMQKQTPPQSGDKKNTRNSLSPLSQDKMQASKPITAGKMPKNQSYSHFGSTTELLGRRPFKEDGEQEISSDHHDMNPQETSEIKELDIFVLKQRCLGMGKRLTWHLGRIHNHHFNPHTVLDNLEHVSYPLNILLHEQQLLSRILAEKLPFVYTQNTKPTFFYSEYKVAIVADFSAVQHNFKIDASKKTSQMQYFEMMRISLEIIIKNLFFSIKNQVFSEIQKQNRMRQMPMARSGAEHMKYMQYQFQGPKGLRQRSAQRMSFPCDTRQVQSDDDSMVSDSINSTNINSFWNRRNINFPIEEQSESVLDSMYESNYPGYDSTKQSPHKKKVSLQKMSQTTQQKGQNNNTSSFGSNGALGPVQATIGSGISSISQGMANQINKSNTILSSGLSTFIDGKGHDKLNQKTNSSSQQPNTTSWRMIQNKQKHELEPAADKSRTPNGFPDYLLPEKDTKMDKGGEHLLKESYEPKVYLSLVIKGVRKNSRSADEDNSTYKTLFVDKQLQYENFEELAKGIDMQLTLIEDELIEDMMRLEINRQQRRENTNMRSSQNTQSLSSQIKKSQIGEMNIIEHGQTILNLMKKDIQPLLVVVGDISNLNISSAVENGSRNLDHWNWLKLKEAKSQKIFDSIIRLQSKDTQVVAIDINSLAKEWADPEHIETTVHQKKASFLNDFKNICFLTQGSYFDFRELVKIDLECEAEFKKNMLQQQAKKNNKRNAPNHHETEMRASEEGTSPAEKLETLKTQNGLKQSQSLNEIKIFTGQKQPKQANLSHLNTSSENVSSNQYFGFEPRKFNLRADDMKWRWNPFLIQSKLRQKQKEESSKQKTNETKAVRDNKVPHESPLLQNLKSIKAKAQNKSTGYQKAAAMPLMNSLQRALFSRKIDSKNDQPKELQKIYDFITKNYKSKKIQERLQLNKNCHPDEVKQYAVKNLYLENELAPRYLKIRIQTNVLKNVNFSRICEFRSKCLFKLHDMKQQPKYNKVYKKIYGERVKYLFWQNSDVVLACHIKNIADDVFPAQIENRRYNAIKGHLISKIKNSKELTIDQKIEHHLQHLTQLQTQQLQDSNQNPELAKVEIVFKIIGQVQTVQKFVRDFAQGEYSQKNFEGNEQHKQEQSSSSQQQSMMKQWLQQRAQMKTQQRAPEHNLCQEVTEIIQEASKSDQTFVVFSEVTNQMRKMFKFISNRQLQMPGKFVISFKQKKQVEQKQAEQSKLNEQAEEQEKEQQPTQPSYGLVRSNSLRAIHMNELDKQHHFVEKDPYIIDFEREQKLKKEKLKKGKHYSKQMDQDQNLSPIQEHIKQNEEFEDVEQYQLMMTQEQVVQQMQENEYNWDVLRECAHLFNNEDLWSKHFSYRRLDFISPSNYTDAAQINELEQIYKKSREHISNSTDEKDKKADSAAGIGAGAMLDSSIIMKTFLALRKLTTFTLDGQTFIQVFKDKKNKNHNDIYGFCLIKVEWLAFNVLSLHQGFYQTNERSKNQFGKAINKALVELNLKNDLQSLAGQKQSKINFSCFNKNVVDRIFQIDHDKKQKIVKQRSRDCPDVTSFLEEISETNKYDELSKEFLDMKSYNIEMITYLKTGKQMMYHQKSQKNKYEVQLIQMLSSDWQFISDNFQTTKEVQISIFRQRLDEGFIFISSFNKANFSTTHFIKVLEGRKCKFYNAQSLSHSIPRKDSMNSFSSGKVSLKDARLNLRRNSLLMHPPNHYRKNYDKMAEQQAIKKQLQIEKEQTQSILVQYIIKFDDDRKALRGENQKYCLRTLLVMEKESCYFLFNKAANVSSRLNLLQSSEEISRDFKNIDALRDRANSVQSNASHDFSVQSSNPDEDLGRKKKNNNIESMSEKNFFFSLQQYTRQVDNYLKTIVCTFHNILKNSLLKSINQEVLLLQQDQRFGGSYDITHQLCYFKNINIQNKRQMKRQNLEKSIKERMQLMRKDQKQFLSKQYPELANDLGTRPLDMLDELRNQTGEAFKVGLNTYKSEVLGGEEQDDDFDKDLLKYQRRFGIPQFPNAFESRHENQQQDYQPENNIFEFDGFLENAQHLLTENLKVPNLEKNQDSDQQIRDQNLAKKITEFYQRLREIFEDFSDFKKQNFEFYEFDLYFKLIAKEIIFIIKVPSQNHFQRLLSKQTVTTIKIEFYIIKKKMIKLTKRLKEHKIYKFFTESQENTASFMGKRRSNGISQRLFQAMSDNLQGTSWQGQSLPKERPSEKISHGKESQSQSWSFMSAQGDASLMSQQAQNREDIDEQINQIDQIEDYLFYYDLNQSSHRILFENQVKKIVDNFLLFIQQSYNKVFSETVLMNLHISDTNNDQSYLTKNDFEQTLKSMSESRFVIDVSFLGLLIRCFDTEHDKDVEESKESVDDLQQKLQAETHHRQRLGQEINNVFHQIKTRNFRECQVDSKYLIFSYNDDDLKIQLPPKQPEYSKILEHPTPNENQEKQADRPYQDDTYIKNLWGGSDAFQEHELQELLITEKKLKRSQPTLFEKTQEGYEIKDTSKMDSINSNLSYQTCKKLIFKVELVVKNSRGEFLIKEPIDDISDMFSRKSAFFSKIKQVVDELETKIKHILKQRGILINDNKSTEKPSMNQEVRFNQQMNQNQEHAEDKDLGLLRLFSKIETESQQKDEAIENLSEDEKLKRYRKIYGVLQQFINDENPNQQLDKLNILNDEKTQQKFEKDMWQSSIEIHFCIHSTPQHIGLIKDKYIDQLCFKRDNILVNADDHEDLIRVCNLFNLFNLNRQEVMSTQKTDFFFQNQHRQSQFSSLFTYFDNRQITRSIPFFFKHSYSQNDYRVYRYDDVQRKLVYGILRRSYALLAEVILQNIMRYSEYDNIYKKKIRNQGEIWIYNNYLGVSLMKKYMGQLLNTQRVYIKYPVLHNHKFRSNLIHQFLINEIKAGHVMKLGSINNQDEIDGQQVVIKQNQSDAFSPPIPYQQIFYLKKNLDFDCDCHPEPHNHSQQPNAIMFLKITQNQQKNCFIEVVFYSNIWEHSPQCPIKQRQNLLKNLKQIQDRVKIKLILLEIDEKKEMNKYLCIKEPQQVIVTHLGTKNKGTYDSIIIRQDSLDKEPEEDADQMSHSKSKLSTIRPNLTASGSSHSWLAGEGGSTFTQGSMTGASNDAQMYNTQLLASLAACSQGDSLTNRSMQGAGALAAGQNSRSKYDKDKKQPTSRQNKSKFLRNMEKFNAEIKPEPSKQDIISQRMANQQEREAQKAKLIELKNQDNQKIQLPEKYQPKKFHEHDFKLTSYIDIESGIQVISGFLVLSPYCIDDSQDLFIFNDLDLRDQKYQIQSKRKKSTKNDVLVNANRYILRIPKIMRKQDLNSNQMKRVDSYPNSEDELTSSRQNKITIEIFGIEPLRDTSIFDNIFEKINTILQNQTIDKFSEKFLTASRLHPESPSTSTDKHNQSMASRRKASTSIDQEHELQSIANPQIQIPFILSSKDLQYIKEKNQKIHMLFPISCKVREKYYFLQLLISLLQTFLIPARKQKEIELPEEVNDSNRKKQSTVVNPSRPSASKGASMLPQQSLALRDGHPSLSMGQIPQKEKPGSMDSMSESMNVNGKHDGTHVDSDQATQRREVFKGQAGDTQAALTDRRPRESENAQLEVKNTKQIQPMKNVTNDGIASSNMDIESSPSGDHENLETEDKSSKKQDTKSEIDELGNAMQDSRYKDKQVNSPAANTFMPETQTNPSLGFGSDVLRAQLSSNETMLLYNHKVTENLLTLEMDDIFDQYDTVASSTSKDISESQHAQRTCLKEIFGHSNVLLSIDYLQDQVDQDQSNSANIDALYRILKKRPIKQIAVDKKFYQTCSSDQATVSGNHEKLEMACNDQMVVVPVVYEQQSKNEEDEDVIITKKSVVIRKKEQCLLDIERARNNFSAVLGLDEELIRKEGNQLQPADSLSANKDCQDLCISLDIQGQLNTQIFTDQLTLTVNFALSTYNIEQSIIKLKWMFDLVNTKQDKLQLFSEFDMTSNSIQEQIRAAQTNKSCMRCFESQLFQPKVSKTVLKVIALIQSFFQRQHEMKPASFSDSSLILQIKMLNLASQHIQRQLMIRLPATFTSTGKADFNTLLKKNLKKVAKIISQQDLTNKNVNMEFRLIFLSANVKLPAGDDQANTKFFDLTPEKSMINEPKESLDFLKAFPSFKKEIQPMTESQFSQESNSKVGTEEDKRHKLRVLREALFIINITNVKLELLMYNFKNCYVLDLVRQLNTLIAKSHDKVNVCHLEHMQRQVLSFGHPLSQIKHKKSWWSRAPLAGSSSNEARDEKTHDQTEFIKRHYLGQLSILQDIHAKLTKEPENLQTVVKKEKPQIEPKPQHHDNGEGYSNEEERNQQLSQEQLIEPHHHNEMEQVHKLMQVESTVPGIRKEYVSIRILEEPQQYLDQLSAANPGLRYFNSCQAADQLVFRLRKHGLQTEKKALRGNGQERTSKVSQVEVQPGFVFKCAGKESSFDAKQLDAIARKLKRAQELSSLVGAITAATSRIGLQLCFKEYNLQTQRSGNIREQGRTATSKEPDGSVRSIRVSGAEKEFLKTVHGLGPAKKPSKKASDKAMGMESERTQIEKILQNSQLVFSQTHQFLIGEQSMTMVDDIIKYLRDNLYVTKDMKMDRNGQRATVTRSNWIKFSETYGDLEAEERDSLEIGKKRSKAVYTCLDDQGDQFVRQYQQQLSDPRTGPVSSNKRQESIQCADYLMRYQSSSRLFSHNKILLEFHQLQHQEHQRKMQKQSLMQQMLPKTTTARLRSVNRSIGGAQTQASKFNTTQLAQMNQQQLSSSIFGLPEKQISNSRKLVSRFSKLLKKKEAHCGINMTLAQDEELLEKLISAESGQPAGTQSVSGYTVKRNYFMRLIGLRSLIICEVIVHSALNQRLNRNRIQINVYQHDDLEQCIDPFLVNELDFDRLVAKLTKCQRTRKAEDENLIKNQAIDHAEAQSGEQYTHATKIWMNLKLRIKEEMESLLSLQLQLRSRINLDVRAYDFYVDSVFAELQKKDHSQNLQVPDNLQGKLLEQTRARPMIDLLDQMLGYFGLHNICSRQKDKRQDLNHFQLSKADNHIETFSLRIEFANLVISDHAQFTSSLLKILALKKFNFSVEDGEEDSQKSSPSMYKLNPCDSDSHPFERILYLRPGVMSSEFKPLIPILFTSEADAASPSDIKSFKPKESARYFVELYLLYRRTQSKKAHDPLNTESLHSCIGRNIDQDVKTMKALLQEAFFICKNIYTKDNLWKQFFMVASNDQENSVLEGAKLWRESRNKDEKQSTVDPKVMANAQIREMLRLSNWVNLEQVGEKYRKLLQKNKFDTLAYSYLVSRLGHMSHNQENQPYRAGSNDICSFNMQEDQDLQESANSSMKPHLSNAISPGPGPVGSYLGSSSSWSSYLKEMIVFDKKKPNIMLNVRYNIKEEKIQILLFQRDNEPFSGKMAAVTEQERQLINCVTNILAHHLWKTICNPNPQLQNFAPIANIYSSDFSETVNLIPSKMQNDLD